MKLERRICLLCNKMLVGWKPVGDDRIWRMVNGQRKIVGRLTAVAGKLGYAHLKCLPSRTLSWPW